MVRILGLDPGSRITGYGVVDVGRGGVRYVASGCIRVGNGQLAGRLLELHRHVSELVEAYVPGAVKQTVTGTGAAEKSQVMHMVKALLALQGRLSADAADALAIAVCHAQHRGAPRPGNGR